MEGNTTFSVEPITGLSPHILKILSRHTELVSTNYAHGLDKYMLIHVKKRPWYLPKSVYYWLTGKLLVMTAFTIPNPYNFILDREPQVADGNHPNL